MKTTIPVMMLMMTALAGLPSTEVFAESLVVKEPSALKSWWRRSFRSLTWDETIATVTSPRSVCWQVRRHVTYRAEAGDQWFDGKTVWDRGYGDCEDFASCIADICDARGFTCWIAAVRTVGTHTHGHCLVMGLWRGQMWLASNGSYYEVSSLEDALKRVAVLLGQSRESFEFVPLSLL